MEAIMLLCDRAEEINGKFYIHGGGWNRLIAVKETMEMDIAVLLRIPWDQANQPHDLATRLVTQDGQQVVGQEGNPIVIEAKIEVGRPPGMKPGEAISTPLVFRFEGLPAQPGDYDWYFEVGGERRASYPFRVIPGAGS